MPQSGRGRKRLNFRDENVGFMAEISVKMGTTARNLHEMAAPEQTRFLSTELDPKPNSVAFVVDLPKQILHLITAFLLSLSSLHFNIL